MGCIKRDQHEPNVLPCSLFLSNECVLPTRDTLDCVVILPAPSSLFSFSLSLFLALFAPNAFRRQIKTTDVYGGGRGRRRGRRGGGSFFFEGILEGKNSLSPSAKRREKKKKEGPSKNQKPKTKNQKPKKRRSRHHHLKKKERSERTEN